MIVDEWKLAAELFGDSAHKDAWHLSMIGVRPELQRRGFGTQLMQFVVAKVDAVRLNTWMMRSHHLQADEARAMMLVETTKFAVSNGARKASSLANLRSDRLLRAKRSRR